MKAIDLGIVTYVFIIFNFSLLIMGVLRLCTGVAFTYVSVHRFSDVRDVSFTSLISETVFVGMNEIAMFLLGILAGYKNNIRLMFTYEFLLSLLVLTKCLSIGESLRNRDIINEDLKLSVEDMFNEFRLTPKTAPGRLHALAIQRNFQCCGLLSPQFYLYQWDDSCCPPDVQRGRCNPQFAYDTGCLGFFHVPPELFNVHFYTLFPVCEVVLLIIGISLITYIRKSARRTFG